MEIFAGILTVLFLIQTVLLFKYQRQVKVICRQLAFLIRNDTNMLITTDMEAGGLGRLAEELNELLLMRRREKRRYQEKEKMISDIYTSLSHDIRTPLTSLDGYFQLLETSNDPREQERYISVIEERIGSLKEMLEELFLFTKLKNDSYRMELSQCCMNKLLKDTVFSYYDEWEKKEITPEILIPRERLYFTGNEQGVKRLLQNVIKNGLDHGKNRIQIRLASSEGLIRLRISNQVEHPEKIDVSRVFERFYKSDAARSRTSSGLGLSIARELAVKMGGELHAGITGSEFWVEGVFKEIDIPGHSF